MGERSRQALSQTMNEAELRVQLEQHHAVCYGWVLSCCARAPEMAEDVLHTAYLKILQGRARYDGRAAFKTWLFAVIRMTALDERRRQWLRHFRLGGYKQHVSPAVQHPDCGGRLDESAKLATFQRVLLRLAKRQQEVMHLVFYEDMSLQEASEVMGVSLGSARTHYERGKRNLRAWLEKSEHFDEYGKDRAQTQTAL